MTARSHFELLDNASVVAFLSSIADGTIPLAKLAALTASRIAATDASGVLTVNGAGTANRMTYWSGAGALGVNGAITTGRLVVSDGSGLLAANANTMTGGQLLKANSSNGHPETIGAITASRALVSDSNGLPTAATLTSANLENAIYAATDTATIDHTVAAGSLSSAVIDGSITAAKLGNFAAGYAGCSNIGGALSATTTSYTDFAGFGYTPRSSASSILVIGWGFHILVAGTTTFAIRRGTTVIGGGTSEPTYTGSGSVLLMATDTGHGGSAQTYNFSAKNSVPSSTVSYAVICVVDAR